MGEGEHTIISRIARERLNQIASRRLSTLGVPVRLGADRETLEGELALAGRLIHPVTSQPVVRARFVVEGHDRFRFLDSPLAALGPVDFFGHERLPTLEQALAGALSKLQGQLFDVSGRLKALGLEVSVDAEKLQVRAVVKTSSHAFEIIGGSEGAKVARIAPVGGRPIEVPADLPPLELGRYASEAELQAWLLEFLPAMAPAAAPPKAAIPPRGPAAVAAQPLQTTPPPRNALTLARLAEVFGAEAMLPPNAMVELVQEYQHAGTRYRFVATREMGTRFKGRLIGPSGDVWSDRFELGHFPGTRKVVALALGFEPADAPAETAQAPQGAGLVGVDTDALEAHAGTAHVPQHLLPQAGEVWVMNVVVEEAGPDEVRYVGTDIDGRPYGAARVLKKADFEAVFTSDRGGWRLLIQIDQVQEGSVLYRQLDQARQPFGAPRKMASAIMIANFVPEAAAY